MNALVRFLQRNALPALLIGALAAAAAWWLSARPDALFEARATVLASHERNFEAFGANLATAPSIDASAYRAAALSDPVLRDALRATGVEAPSREALDALEGRVDVAIESATASSLVHIDVRDPSAELAAERANALADALVAWDRARATDDLETVVESLINQIEALDTQIANLEDSGDAFTEDQLTSRQDLRADQQEQLYYARTMRDSAIGLLRVMEPAAPPAEPVSPRPLRNGGLALALGVLLTYGGLSLREALDTRLRGSEDMVRVSGLPVLAEFPEMSGGNRRLPREPSGYLRTNVLFATSDAHPKTILVTSSLAAEGKSSVALSLAESFARSDYRTLLVGADLRKPVLADVYGLKRGSAPSLADHMADPDGDHKFLLLEIGSGKRMAVIPAFDAVESASELLSSGFARCLERWKAAYDVIVVDSAPVLPVADTLVVAPHCTGTVIAASAAHTNRKYLDATVQLLRRVGIPLLGVVATRMPERGARAQGYGYGYGYGGYGRNAGGQAPKRRTDATRADASQIR